jgi:hypothetical protein
MAMAAYDGRFNSVEGDLRMIRGDINMIHGEANIIRRDLNLLKWMNVITWALCFGIFFKLFLH